MSCFESIAGNVGHDVLSKAYEKIKTYRSYIKNCEDNLKSLGDELETLLAEKVDIDDKVRRGNETLTAKGKDWLHRVKKLVNNESMKFLMNKDMRIAKVMLRLLEDDLKKSVEKDGGEMCGVVVKVMKDIAKRKREAGNSQVNSDVDEKDEKVGEVLEKLVEKTIGEFEKLMRDDVKMATAAMHLLENHMEKLKPTEKDQKVADIIANATKTSRDAELLSDSHDDDDDVNLKTLKAKVKNLLKPVGNIIMNEEVLNTLPDNVRIGIEAMGVVIGNRRELKAELMDSDNTTPHRNCCWLGCCDISYNYFFDRYHMSVAAKTMLEQTKVIIEKKRGIQDVTRPKRRGEMEGIPTYCVGLESRNQLYQDIIKALASNDVHALGIYGMGGSGKTTLAKEIFNSKADGTFETAVMVEISESPNIEYIQDQIGGGLGLEMHKAHGISEKATLIYNRLKQEHTQSGGKDDKNAKKILIVLDNIWNKIDLLQMGIPHEYCKRLVTSREWEVCKAMDVQDVNIFNVGLLNKDEAKDLFKFQVHEEVTGEYNIVADRLLKKCKGLPLAIVATANSLKGKKLPFWLQFADELEKPIPCQIRGVLDETFSILRTSYEVMESEDKKKFFLLACLSPIGSSISIDNLMRYGIGLGLFQHVNKLSEAIDCARTWAEELVSSSMLLKGYSDEYVKIHDVVRESTMSFASKSGINTDGQMFLVDAIPRWISKETFNKYTHISLLAQANFARLSGVKADLLQILLFKGNENHSSLESDFFNEMTNLKVLEVSFMNFEEGLPRSMGKLKVLKTLHLVECKLRDMKLIGKLGSLLVLSLRGSSLERLPDEIGNLHELRLLDMRMCECMETRIPANVITRLSLLEGLYFANRSHIEWAAMDEFNNLEFLNVLEMRMSEPESVPIGAQFLENLDKFQIIVGQKWSELQPSERALMVSDVDVSQELKKDNCLKALLKKADFLALKRAKVNNIVPELDKQGFRDLGRLELSNIDSISRICKGKAPTELFCNLCNLQVSNLKQLEVLLPINSLPRKMTALQISDCDNLTYIFSADDGVNKDSDIIELPCLKKLKLSGVSNLISVVKESNNDDSPRPSFFNSKVTLTSLEELWLKYNERIVKLWDKESNPDSFQNLKVLEIIGCREMETVGPLSMFRSLVQLESLTITNCKKMQQVISDGNETREVPKESITFPNLKHLEMWDMGNLECFYGGSCKMAFPRLKDLRLCYLNHMTRFAGGINSTAFFSKTIEFPCLEELRQRGEMRVLWELHDEGEGQGISSNPVPNLRRLQVGQIKLPSIVFPSLSYLYIKEPVIGDAKFLFSSSSSENEGCGTYSQFPKLEQLTIEGLPNSALQFVKDDGSPSMLNFCGQLKTLVLKSTWTTLINIEVTSLHLFTSLRELEISGLTSEYLFSVDRGFKQLPSLEKLFIMDCPNMKVIIQGGDKDKAVVFPRLKKLVLSRLESMSKLCSISDIPSLEYVFINSCNKLESLFCGEPNQVVELPSLENVEISSCHGMKSFSTRPLKAPNLRDVRVYGCYEMEWFLLGNSNWNADVELPSLEYCLIVRCPIMKSFLPVLRAPRLRELDVADCNQWEWLFDGEPNQVVELPSLEQLTINECDAMKYFSTRSLKATNLREVTVSNCAEMEWFLLGNSNCNADLELPSLEKVAITKCLNMKSFLPALLRAPRLRELNVAECNKWEWLLDGEPNQVVELPSLEQVTIYECDAMKYFSTRPLKAPKLRQLTLSNCPDMVCFLSGNSNCNADLELPSLEKVTIEKCPNLKSFSPAVLRAPKLKLVEIDDKLYPIDEIKDFNHFLQFADSSEQTAPDKNNL